MMEGTRGARGWSVNIVQKKTGLMSDGVQGYTNDQERKLWTTMQNTLYLDVRRSAQNRSDGVNATDGETENGVA